MFKFKQFTIDQSKTAMKVCTDACIFGAYIQPNSRKKILDIGAGTGLLSLMMAQRTESKIDAVEIDENAYNQALENISESVFKNQISVYHCSVQDFSKNQNNDYDLIVSNPPFFQNSLKSPNIQANKAHHDTTLTFEELVQSVKKLLASEGEFKVLLPPFEMQTFEKIALKNQLFLNQKLKVRHSSKHKIFREICSFSYQKTEIPQENELNIYEDDNKTYSENFKSLLKDYYLIF